MRKNGKAGILLNTPDGEKFGSSLRLEFRTTNNKAEYEAVIVGLGMDLELGAESLKVQSDSQVIVGHIQREFEAKGENMKMYLSKVHNMQSSFQKFYITKIPREDNEKVNCLARMGSAESRKAKEGGELIWSLTHPSISDQASKLAITEELSD